MLAEHIINDFAKSQNLSPERLAHMLTRKGKLNANLEGLLLRHQWKENVTELKAYLKCLLPTTFLQALDEQEKIELMKMMLMIEEGNEFSLRQSLSVIEEGIIQRALKTNAGHQTKAAQLLGISDRALRRNTSPV
jgi:DNA-binding NtrC family response regulator